jgi:hypothetical protein
MDDFSKNRVNSSQNLQYFFGFILIQTCASWSGDSIARQSPLIHNSINTLTSIGAVLWCYRANGGKAGKDFVDRFFAFSVASFLRVLIFSTIYIGVVGVVMWGLGHPEIKDPTLHQLVYDLLEVPTVVFWFWYVGRHLRDLHQKMIEV